MTVYLIVGLPGAGKTTRAKQLEVSASALRLTPDEWQMAIFPGDGPAGWRATERADQRDRIEGKLVELGMRAARLGVDVLLDFGFWARDERSALRWIAASAGVPAQVVYLPIDFAEQRRRVSSRYATEPGHFDMTDDELRQWHGQFQAPDQEELRGTTIPPGPTRMGDLVLLGVRALAVAAAPVRPPDRPVAVVTPLDWADVTPTRSVEIGCFECSWFRHSS